MARDAAAWWALFGALAVAASKVIYGLRKQVGNVRALGQYYIEAQIGAGAMGIVYRARHAHVPLVLSGPQMPHEAI
jgi:hypothetical protein